LTSPATHATRGAETALTSTLASWKTGLDTLAEQVRTFAPVTAFPQLDATKVVERQYAFIRQLVDLNHEYARSLAELANTLTGTARQQIESVGSVARDQVHQLSDAARGGVERVEQTVRDQAQQAERVEREAREQAEEAQRQQAREAARAERQQRKEARDQAGERYQSLTKTELSDEAGKRGLPKTGTVDELVDRLVEDDTK
jgi:hypothetical protein